MKIIILIMCFFLLSIDSELANDEGVMRWYMMDTVYCEAKLPTMWIEVITAYSPSVDECDSRPYETATGDSVRMGCVAADPKYLPMHSLIIVPGYHGSKVCEVLDTGSKIKGRKIDVFFWTKQEAKNYGMKRNKEILIVRYGK